MLPAKYHFVEGLMCKCSHVQEQFFFHSLDWPPYAEDMQLQQEFRGGGY